MAAWALGNHLRAPVQTVLSLVYPPRCLGCGGLVESDFGLCAGCWAETPFVGGTVCDSCGAPVPGETDGGRIECDDCLRRPRPWSDGRAALIYDGRARHLVMALKHGDRADIARPAADWMVRAAGPALLAGDPLVVPIPLHWRRMMKRRYNQAALLAQAVAKAAALDWCPDLLQRPRHTLSLDHRSATERFATLEDAIRPHPRRGARAQGRIVLIVDDVMTSGATFAAATQAVRAAGAADVRVLALARVTKTP
ncbi:double zinc ribbon domain-containing protein [Chachezhania sediminis]|uniref:double zinc ribbon domain-containing protein n=1 Tax=Chachezhania sediminis TaxID=2599291 RepID=UPI00131AE6A6|nr:double zinc ribbon domain-containing protein [Chachezhania sediminis]